MTRIKTRFDLQVIVPDYGITLSFMTRIKTFYSPTTSPRDWGITLSFMTRIKTKNGGCDYHY